MCEKEKHDDFELTLFEKKNMNYTSYSKCNFIGNWCTNYIHF